MAEMGAGGTTAELFVRPAVAADRPFLFGLAPRLAGAAVPAGRSLAELVGFQDRFMQAVLDRPDTMAATLVAVDWQGRRQGFVHVEPAEDGITAEPCGYVALLAVTQPAEGHGVADCLMAAAEEWARRQGYRYLTLEVFAGNARARRFYARQGYIEESLRLSKRLDQSEPDPLR